MHCERQSLSLYTCIFFFCSFVYSGCTWSLRILASYFLSLSLSPHSWSAGACFLSAPTMGGLLGSRCLRPWKRESVQADEKYISLKTPLPFPWPLPCIYNPSFAASQAKYVTFTSFSFFFSLFLSARYSSAAALLGLWRVQEALLRGSRRLICLLPDLQNHSGAPGLLVGVNTRTWRISASDRFENI